MSPSIPLGCTRILKHEPDVRIARIRLSDKSSRLAANGQLASRTPKNFAKRIEEEAGPST